MYYNTNQWNEVRFMQIRQVKSILMMSFLLFIVIILFKNSPKEQAQALKIWDIEPVSVNGQWEFYWNKLLIPQDFHGNLKHQHIMVPGAWEHQNVGGEQLSNRGFGTYRTQLMIPQRDVGKQQAFQFQYIASAYRMWINGDEYPGLGKVGRTIAEETPHMQKSIVVFEPKTTNVEVVIQVSNFSFRDGGILGDVSMGPVPIIVQSMYVPAFLSLIQIGSVFIIGMYYLVIYYRRKIEKDFYYFGLLALTYAMRAFFLEEYVVNLFFPTIPWIFVARIEYLSNIVALLLLACFVKAMYPLDANYWYVRITYAISLIFCVIILFASPYVFTSLLAYNGAITVGILFLFMIDLSMKVKKHQREDANLNMLSVFMLLLVTIYEVSNYIWTFSDVYMLDIAFFVFILLQAVILSNRYNRMNENNQKLTEELVILNNSLEKKVEDRTLELVEKNEELSQLQRAKTKMLANIAHDIGTPLAGVITFLQILKEGKIKVDTQSTFQDLIEQVKYVQYLNNDLLELSKLESKKLVFHMEELKAASYFSSVYERIRLESVTDAVRIQLGHCETTIDEKDVYIIIDQIRIRQVMVNFLSNAIKYNDSIVKEITVCWHVHYHIEKKQHEVIIEFEDNGQGISAEELPFLFDRFYRIVEGNIEGSGLGLAIVKEIIEQHGGEVGVKNKEGEGSIFYFTLPAVIKA